MASKAASEIRFSFLNKKIQARPGELAKLCQRIVSDAAYRKKFESDPTSELAAAGIKIPREIAERALGKSLTQFLQAGGDPLSLLRPGDLDIPDFVKGQQSPLYGANVVAVAVVAVAIASTPAVAEFSKAMKEDGLGPDGKGSRCSMFGSLREIGISKINQLL